MIFKNLPALMTLMAAFIVCLITFIYKYELTKALVVLLVSIIVFYIIGLSIRALLNKFLGDKPEEQGNETELEMTEEEEVEEET